MRTKYIDFHTHTKYSDGKLEPKQIVEFSALNGIDILAITDHDHIQAYFDAKETAKEYGIKLITGTEITTPKYHLIGLNFNPNDKGLVEFLEESRKLQRENCETRVKILQNEGIPITMGKIEGEFPYSRLGKGNIKEILTKDPECRRHLRKKHPNFSPLEIYKHYLGKEGIASNIGRVGRGNQETINIIHQAGGIIGIAHPPKDIDEIEELEILLSQGIDFLEVQPNLKPKYHYQIFEDFANNNGLPLSFGSDYHGPTMDRPMFTREENILTEGLEKLLIKVNLKRETKQSMVVSS